MTEHKSPKGRLPWWAVGIKLVMSKGLVIRQSSRYGIDIPTWIDIPMEDDVREYIEDCEINYHEVQSPGTHWSRKTVLKHYPHEYAQGYNACLKNDGDFSKVKCPYKSNRFRAWVIGWNDYYIFNLLLLIEEKEQRNKYRRALDLPPIP